MTKPTETQTIILSAGAQRPDNIALPLRKGLHGAAAKITISKMIEHGWLQEVDADLGRGEPLWRETGDGHGTTLVVGAKTRSMDGAHMLGQGDTYGRIASRRVCVMKGRSDAGGEKRKRPRGDTCGR